LYKHFFTAQNYIENYLYNENVIRFYKKVIDGGNSSEEFYLTVSSGMVFFIEKLNFGNMASGNTIVSHDAKTPSKFTSDCKYL
jgi:hypothetical protein